MNQASPALIREELEAEARRLMAINASYGPPRGWDQTKARAQRMDAISAALDAWLAWRWIP